MDRTYRGISVPLADGKPHCWVLEDHFLADQRSSGWALHLDGTCRSGSYPATARENRA